MVRLPGHSESVIIPALSGLCGKKIILGVCIVKRVIQNEINKLIGKEPFDLDEFISLIFKMVQQIEAIKSSEDVIFFLGASGSGKSTTINYLRGCLYKLITAGTKIFYQAQAIESCKVVAEVGHDNLNSKTLYPSIYNSSSNDIKYCDLPGFYETRSLTYRLVTSLGIDVVIKEVKTIRGFAVIISEDMLIANKGFLFKEFLYNFIDTIGDVDAIKNSLIFIFTKINPILLQNLNPSQIREKLSTDLQNYLNFEKEQSKNQKSYCALAVRNSFSHDKFISDPPGDKRYIYVLTPKDLYFVDIIHKQSELIPNMNEEKIRNLRGYFGGSEKSHNDLSTDDLNVISQYSGHLYCSTQMGLCEIVIKRTEKLLGYITTPENNRLFYINNLAELDGSEKIISAMSELQIYNDRTTFKSFLHGLLDQIFKIIVKNTSKHGVMICQNRYELLAQFSETEKSLDEAAKTAKHHFSCLETFGNILESDQISDQQLTVSCLPTQGYHNLSEIIGNIKRKQEEISSVLLEIKTLEDELANLENNKKIEKYTVPKKCEILEITTGEQVISVVGGVAVVTGVVGAAVFLAPQALVTGFIAGLAKVGAVAVTAGVKVGGILITEPTIALTLGGKIAGGATAISGVASLTNSFTDYLETGKSWFSSSGWFPGESASESNLEQTYEETLSEKRAICGFYHHGGPYQDATARIVAFDSQGKKSDATSTLKIENNSQDKEEYKAQYACYKGYTCSSSITMTMEHRYLPETLAKIHRLQEKLSEEEARLQNLKNELKDLQQQKTSELTVKKDEMKKALLLLLSRIQELVNQLIILQRAIRENNADFTHNQDLFEVVSVTQHLLTYEDEADSRIKFITRYKEAKKVTTAQIGEALAPRVSWLETVFHKKNQFHWIDFLLENKCSDIVFFITADGENIIHLMAKHNYPLSKSHYEYFTKNNFDFDTTDSNGNTAIEAAAYYANGNLANLMLDQVKITQIQKLILLWVNKNDSPDFFAEILKKKSELCKTITHEESSCKEMVLYPLENSPNPSNGNLLHLLVTRNLMHHFKAALQFKEYQKYLYELDSQDRSPLSLAAFLGHDQIVRIVLDGGSFALDREIKKNGNSVAPPIFWAILGKQVYTACLLLRKLKAYPNHGNYYSNAMPIMLPETNKVAQKSPGQYADEKDPSLHGKLKLCDSPNFQENRHPKNLVFQGGGPRAVAFIGALKRLTDYKFSMNKVERIVGTSAGAIMASFLATGHTIGDIENILKNMSFINLIVDDILKHFNPDNLINLLQSAVEISSTPISALKFALKQDGLCDGTALLNFIEFNVFAKTKIQNLTFGELAKKVKKDPQTYKHLYIVATALNPPKIVIFSSENPEYDDYVIAHAVRLSAGLPAVFSPDYPRIKHSNGQINQVNGPAYIDGGLLKNYALDILDFMPFQKGFRGDINDKTAFHNPDTLGFRLIAQDQQKELGSKSIIQEMIDKHFALLKLLDRIFSIFYNAEQMQLEYRGLDKDSRSININDLGLSGYNFMLSTESVNQLLLNGADAIDDKFKQSRKIDPSKISKSVFFAEAAASTLSINPPATTRSLHFFIEPSPTAIPQGRGFDHDEARWNDSIAAYPLVTYRQPHTFESQLYDSGRWDDVVEQHPKTGKPIFTYWVFKMGQKVGSGKFYGHPLLCRSEDGNRHNLIETTGVLTRFDVDAAVEQVDDICTELPPTETEQLKSVSIASATHGAMRGTANVIGRAMEQKGFSHSLASKAREAFYYAGMFTVSTIGYYSQDHQQDDEVTKLTTAAYQGAADTASLFIFNTLLKVACKASHWLAQKADRAGWYQSASFCKGVAQYADYSIYAYNTLTRGPVDAGISIASGTLAQTAVECVGNAVLN